MKEYFSEDDPEFRIFEELLSYADSNINFKNSLLDGVEKYFKTTGKISKSQMHWLDALHKNLLHNDL